MRKIEVKLNGDRFVPGEIVKGQVLVICDGDFQCERLFVSLIGEEVARVVIHAGKVTIVHEEKREHINETYDLAECQIIPMGESRYEFSFTLPSDIPGSYTGSYGSIKYKLHAKAEISRARDLKTDVDLYVPFTSDLKTDSLPSHKSGNIEIDGNIILQVQIENDHITLGDRLSFRFSVDRTAKIRGVRADLIRVEHVAPKNHKMETKRTIAEEYYPDKELTRDLWREAIIHSNVRWNPSFSSELITCNYLLKITLDIPLRLDAAIEIPIILGRSKTDDKSVFDF